MTDLDKAREWAESVGNIEGLMPGTRATVEVIQSLPDQWVDAEKLERIIAGMNCCLMQGSETNFSDGFKEATTTWRDALKALIPPKLPTLADMTQDEREACQWMQARVEGDGYDTFVIASVGEQFNKVLRPDGLHEVKGNGQVTPLPDLPKLEWPGGEVVETPALPEGMRLADHETLGRIVVSQRADEDGDYAFFESIPGGIAGASWGYVNKSELTFLDGGQHA